MSKILMLICGILFSSAAMAQDYGLTVGVHQTTATTDVATSGGGWMDGTTGSMSGSLGYDLGLTASFELIPNFRFRTGFLYDYMPADYKITAGPHGTGTLGVRFSYIDIPVNAQYNFTQMFGIYGGLIVGVKASDNANVPSGYQDSPNAKALMPFYNVGVNFLFNDLIGFDVYYKGGIGSFADDFKNFSTVGMHFIYWL